MNEPGLTQIVTGAYSYWEYDKVGKCHQSFSHALYGLDEYGIVWKFIQAENYWIKLREKKQVKRKA